ncbi:RDD family protein [Bacillus piscicola]|uniref:RDD family protein n=1 Tax=Bacillus piscicola TaxID=1632684 RepID=UPI001F09D125|nr:RDD family protein [Bacillus piscicola]
MVRNPAGFWRRLAANLLDGIVIGIPLAVISYIITGNAEGDWFTNLLSLAYAIIVPVVWFGYTVGKRIMGVRIVKVNGNKLGVGAMLLRTFVAGLIYAITIGIAALISAFMVGLRDDKRSIHDMLAGTYVTKNTP